MFFADVHGSACIGGRGERDVCVCKGQGEMWVCVTSRVGARGVYVCVCVTERGRERKRSRGWDGEGRECERICKYWCVYLCVYFDRVYDFATTDVSHPYDRTYEYDCW